MSQGDPQNPNPLAALLNPTAQPAAPQQPSPPVPQAQAVGGGGPTPPPSTPPDNPMTQMTQQLMGQSQQAMNNPMGQAVPQGGGLIDALKHPMVAGLIKVIAQIAQSGGWTAMMPQERLERTQLNQQKAESLSRLAETGAYQGGSLDIRQQGVGINQQKADTGDVRANTAEEKNKILQGHYNFMEEIAQEKNDISRDKNDVDQAFKEGRLDQINQMIDQKADQFSQKLQQNKDLTLKSLAARTGANDIRKYYIDTMNQVRMIGLQQHNADIVAKAQETLGKLQSMNWLQDAMGMTGPETAAQGVQGLGNVKQALPNISVPTGAPSMPTPQPQNKGAAKRQQAAPQGVAPPQRPPNVPAGAQWDASTRTWRM